MLDLLDNSSFGHKYQCVNTSFRWSFHSNISEIHWRIFSIKLLNFLILLENINLSEWNLHWWENWVVIVDNLLLQLLRRHHVLIVLTQRNESVDELLRGRNRVISPFSRNSPLIAVLLWMVLGRDDRILLGLDSGYELCPISSGRSGNQFPELFHPLALVKGCFQNSPGMMVVHDPIPCHQITVLCLVQRLQQHTVIIVNLLGLCVSRLSKNLGQNTHVICLVSCQVHQGFVTQAGCPNRISSPL